MDNGVEEKREFKSLISGIKRISDDPKDLGGNSYDKYKEDLSVKGNATTKNINDYTSKTKGKTENNKNIFSDILETVDGFLGSEDDSTSDSGTQSKTLKYAKQAAQKSLNSARQLIINEVKQAYFSGEGGCNSDQEDPGTTYYISPKSFDFINMLKVNPESTSGQVMYETQPDPGIGIQFNRKLYEKFGTPATESIETRGGTKLFDIAWDEPSQTYAVTVDSGTNISGFIDDYYNSIEQASIGDVLQTAMMGTLQGDGTEGSSFDQGMDYLNRLLTKCLGACDTSSDSGSSPFLNNATKQIQEDDDGTKSYFNFDDVEGIDLDSEDARRRRVLKFTDCNNFEVPINPNHMEDFVYLLGSKNIDDNIDDTLKKAAADAHGQSDSGVYLGGFLSSLTTDYITQIPNALISSILSPKMIFPITLSYYMLVDVIEDVKELMSILSDMFYDLIKSLFWTFIQEFWKLIKKDLLNFVKKTATIIILNKFKKVKGIILILIGLLLKVLEGDINSCEDIFSALLNVIKAALNRSVNIPVPGLLLFLSESLPGFSSDRAYMDALDRVEASGINTEDIYGTENKLPSLIKSTIEAYSHEMDTNSYVKIGMSPTVIPSGPGGAVISPLVTGSGKLF